MADDAQHERPGGIANDPLVASIVGALLILPSVAALIWLVARPNDEIAQALSLVILFVDFPLALIAFALFYNAVRIIRARRR